MQYHTIRPVIVLHMLFDIVSSRISELLHLLGTEEYKYQQMTPWTSIKFVLPISMVIANHCIAEFKRDEQNND
jgi:hypothetical protein